MSEHIELKVRGSKDFSGRIAGRGTLTLELGDASEAKLLFDYREDSRLRLGLESGVGLRIGADDTLRLSGGLTRELLNQELEGRVSARLKLARDLDVEVEQAFGSRGGKTSMSLTLRL